MFLYPMSIKLIIQNVIECLTTIKKNSLTLFKSISDYFTFKH